MWSLVKLKNNTKAIFCSQLLKKTKRNTHVNIGGMDITCRIIKKSDNIMSLQAGLMSSPVFKHTSVSLQRNSGYNDASSLNGKDLKSNKSTMIVSEDCLDLLYGSKLVNSSVDDTLSSSQNGDNTAPSFQTDSITYTEQNDSSHQSDESAAHSSRNDSTAQSSRNDSTNQLVHSVHNDSTVHSVQNDNTDYSVENDSISQSSHNRGTAHSSQNETNAPSSQDDSDYHIENLNGKTSMESSVSDFAEKTKPKLSFSPINIEKPLLLPVAPDSKGFNKAYFCQFCKKKVKKYARHLEMIHSTVEDVQSFLKFEKNSHERKYAITRLRNLGAVMCNSNPEYHKGQLQVSRQQSMGLSKTSESLDICENCNGFYSYKSIKNHVCVGKTLIVTSNKREGKVIKRQRFLHCRNGLSDRMRLDILPSYRSSEFAKIVKNDELILEFGEHKCRKLPDEHNNNHIKSQMLYAAKILAAAKQMNAKISSMQSLLYPEHYSTIVSAIKQVAGWKNDRFEHPNVATNLTTIIVQLADRFEIQMIQCADEIIKNQKLPLIKEFQSLINKEFSSDINKIAMRNYVKDKAEKPSKSLDDDDVQKFYEFISEKSKYWCDKLKEFNKKNLFDYDTWLNLMETVLLGIIAFNKRRVGETQRIRIEDFQKARKVTKDHPAWKKLTEVEKQQAKAYSRFVIVGKLYNAVPVLLDEHFLECFDLIITLRGKAGVRDSNPYVFGLPNQNVRKNKTLDACQLFRKYSPLVGAQNPQWLRGTFVRKHLATKILDDGESSQKVESAAKFMGHAANIHRGVYQQREVEDITRISSTLERSIGKAFANRKISKTLNNSGSSDEMRVSANLEYGTLRSGAVKRKFVESYQQLRSKRVKRGEIDSDSDSYTSSPEVPRKKTILKRRWSDEDKRLLCEFFFGAILKKKAPSNEAMRKFLEENPFFTNRKLDCIRSFITRVMKNPGKFMKFLPKSQRTTK